MKILFIALFLVSFLQSDEIQRIDIMVQDIAKLRAQNEKCQESLKSKETIKTDIIKYKKNKDEIAEYQRLLKSIRQKNVILKAQVDYVNDASLNSKREIKKYKNLLKAKEKELISLKKELSSLSKKSSKSTKPIQVCKKEIDDNPFPKLMSKEKVKKKLKKKSKVFRAGAFRLKVDSIIYDAPRGKKIAQWEKNTSFTSNKKTEKWVKITGYFVDRKWRKSKKNMWIKLENTFQRK